MSVYRRNKVRCQRWNQETGVWADCPLNEPETRVRKATEGMVVGKTEDFTAEGALTGNIEDLMAALLR